MKSVGFPFGGRTGRSVAEMAGGILTGSGGWSRLSRWLRFWCWCWWFVLCFRRGRLRRCTAVPLRSGGNGQGVFDTLHVDQCGRRRITVIAHENATGADRVAFFVVFFRRNNSWTGNVVVCGDGFVAFRGSGVIWYGETFAAGLGGGGHCARGRRKDVVIDTGHRGSGLCHVFATR